MKYIDAEKLITELRRQKHELELSIQSQGDYGQSCHIVAYENILSLITSLQQEQPEVIGGVVHHALGNHWVVVNQKQLCARLKQFSEGAEVGILVNARKEETK